MDTSNMVEITGTDLREFAKAVYDLSRPQGLGMLHYTTEPVTDDLIDHYINDSDDQIALSMDYVRGRACKMRVFREDGKLFIPQLWYDHTDEAFKKLLTQFGIASPEPEKHGVACNCPECELKHKMEKAQQ